MNPPCVFSLTIIMMWQNDVCIYLPKSWSFLSFFMSPVDRDLYLAYYVLHWKAGIGEGEEDSVQLSALSGVNSAVENHFGQFSLFNEYSTKGHKGLAILLQLGTTLKAY